MVENETTKINDDGSIEAKSGLNQFFYSNPESSDPKEYCVPILTVANFDNLPWHWHREKPADDLVNPVWSVKQNTWIESAPKTQTQLIAKLQGELDSANDKIANLQQSANSQVDTSKKVDALQGMQLMMTKTLSQFSGQMNGFATTMQKVVDKLNNLDKTSEGGESHD